MQKYVRSFLKNWRTSKTELHGFLQNVQGRKRCAKRQSETSAGQSSLAGFFSALRKIVCKNFLQHHQVQ
jgi:hypothetical protein